MNQLFSAQIDPRLLKQPAEKLLISALPAVVELIRHEASKPASVVQMFSDVLDTIVREPDRLSMWKGHLKEAFQPIDHMMDDLRILARSNNCEPEPFSARSLQGRVLTPINNGRSRPIYNSIISHNGLSHDDELFLIDPYLARRLFEVMIPLIYRPQLSRRLGTSQDTPVVHLEIESSAGVLTLRCTSQLEESAPLAGSPRVYFSISLASMIALQSNLVIGLEQLCDPVPSCTLSVAAALQS